MNRFDDPSEVPDEPPLPGELGRLAGPTRLPRPRRTARRSLPGLTCQTGSARSARAEPLMNGPPDARAGPWARSRRTSPARTAPGWARSARPTWPPGCPPA